MPGEQASDEFHQNPKDRFKRDIFTLYMHDKVISEMNSRFIDFHSRVKHFGCLMPANIGNNSMLKDLAWAYSEDIDSKLVEKEYSQFCMIYEELKPERESVGSLQDMLLWVFKHDLHIAYPNVGLLYPIFGTITVSSATTERTFSKLRILKTYLRATMGE